MAYPWTVRLEQSSKKTQLSAGASNLKSWSAEESASLALMSELANYETIRIFGIVSRGSRTVSIHDADAIRREFKAIAEGTTEVV